MLNKRILLICPWVIGACTQSFGDFEIDTQTSTKDAGPPTAAGGAGGAGGRPTQNVTDAATGRAGAGGVTGDAGGAAAPDATANGNSDATATDASTCPAPLQPPGGVCSDTCSRCEGNRCIIECLVQDDCQDQIFDCPADFECEVVCAEKNSCRRVEVRCPVQYACNIDCSVGDACHDTIVTCTDGPCNVDCVEDGCNGAAITCGSGPCNVACDGGKTPSFVECSNSCGCMSTGC